MHLFNFHDVSESEAYKQRLYSVFCLSRFAYYGPKTHFTGPPALYIDYFFLFPRDESAVGSLDFDYAVLTDWTWRSDEGSLVCG